MCVPESSKADVLLLLSQLNTQQYRVERIDYIITIIKLSFA